MADDHSAILSHLCIRLRQTHLFTESRRIEVESTDFNSMTSFTLRRIVLDEVLEDGLAVLAVLNKQMCISVLL